MENWVEDYENKLSDLNMPYNEIQKYISLAMPAQFYRYRKFNEYWEDEIFNGQVFMSTADKLNDPFDSMFYIQLDNYMRYANELMKNVINLIPKDKAREIFIQEVKKMTLEFQDYVRIACFSEVKDSILMWSHYSDNHRGYCLQYDTQKLLDNSEKLFLPIVYSKLRYEASMCLATRNRNIALNPVLFKATEWHYEKEWRMFAVNENSNIYANLKGSISAIYLGANCRLDEKVEKKLSAWSKENRISVFKMNMSRTDYKLIPEPFI